MDDGQFTVVSTPLPPFFFSRLLSSRGKEFVPRMAGLQKKIKDSPSPVLLILPAASICSSSIDLLLSRVLSPVPN